MSYDNRPIGVFDSGLGGLTALRETEKILPGEKLVYFGDTGRVPYGTRSRQTIIKYSMDDLRFLKSKDVKAVLVACGTVSSIALEELQRASDFPVIGVVKPACERAVLVSKDAKQGTPGHIAVLGTPATARQGAYAREIERLDRSAQVMSVGCPMFVPLAENGYIGENQVSVMIAKEYLLELRDFSPCCIILGCTHYPLLRASVEKACLEIFGYIPEIIDVGVCAVRSLEKTLEDRGMCAGGDGGATEFFVSDETQNFSRIAGIFLGREISNVTKIDIDKF